MDITYVIHIATTAESLWQALTSPGILKDTWGDIRSEWTANSPVREVDHAGKVLWTGDVLRSDPPHVLSFTMDVPGIGEPPTTVTFEIRAPLSPVAPGAQVVRLSVTQSGFVENSTLIAGCARAWTEILSSLKSDVETGHPIPFRWHG